MKREPCTKLPCIKEKNRPIGKRYRKYFEYFNLEKYLKLLFSGRKVQNINTTCVNMTSLVLSQEILSWFDRILRRILKFTTPTHTCLKISAKMSANDKDPKFSEKLNQAVVSFKKNVAYNITCRYVITCNFFIVTICFGLS